jgi:hypothetical protein
VSPTIALLALALLAAPAGKQFPDGGAPAGDAPPPACPPSPEHQHCLVVTVIPQRHPGAFASLLARLRKEGVRTSSDGPGQLAVHQTDQEIERFWGARVVHRRLAASSHDGFTCQTALEGVRIPKRYRGQIARVSVGHQICE